MPTAEVEAAEEETTLEEDLGAAFDAIEADDTEEIKTTEEVIPDEEVKPEAGGSDEDSPEEEVTTKQDEEQKTEGKAEDETVVSESPAPQSWSAPNREHWGKLPAEVQAQVTKREREIDAGLRDSAEARRFQEQFNQTIQPYMGTVQVEAGGDAILATKNLLNIATALRTGAGPQKAQIVAQIIAGYGVDIATLDGILSGQVGPQQGQVQQPMGNPQQFRDPRVDAMLQQQQQESVQEDADIQLETDTFMADPKNEFAADVRDDMADLLEMAGRRNQTLSLQDAYDRAVKIRPDLQTVLTGRELPPEDKKESLKRKKRAASSIKGTPSGDGKGMAGGGSLADDLNAAWDASVEGA
jgi:hypothetical protein